MKYVLPLLLAGVFTSALAQPEPQPAAERAALNLALQGCLRSNAAMLDDRTSPASDIARAVAFRCSDAWAEFASVGNHPREALNALSLVKVLEGRSSSHAELRHK